MDKNKPKINKKMLASSCSSKERQFEDNKIRTSSMITIKSCSSIVLIIPSGKYSNYVARNTFKKDIPELTRERDTMKWVTLTEGQSRVSWSTE